MARAHTARQPATAASWRCSSFSSSPSRWRSASAGTPPGDMPFSIETPASPSRTTRPQPWPPTQRQTAAGKRPQRPTIARQPAQAMAPPLGRPVPTRPAHPLGAPRAARPQLPPLSRMAQSTQTPPSRRPQTPPPQIPRPPTSRAKPPPSRSARLAAHLPARQAASPRRARPAARRRPTTRRTLPHRRPPSPARPLRHRAPRSLPWQACPRRACSWGRRSGRWATTATSSSPSSS